MAPDLPLGYFVAIEKSLDSTRITCLNGEDVKRGIGDCWRLALNRALWPMRPSRYPYKTAQLYGCAAVPGRRRIEPRQMVWPRSPRGAVAGLVLRANGVGPRITRDPSAGRRRAQPLALSDSFPPRRHPRRGSPSLRDRVARQRAALFPSSRERAEPAPRGSIVDTTLIVICAAVLIWIGLGSPAPTGDDARCAMVGADHRRDRPRKGSC
jgi:hypothetical protein